MQNVRTWRQTRGGQMRELDGEGWALILHNAAIPLGSMKYVERCIQLSIMRQQPQELSGSPLG